MATTRRKPKSTAESPNLLREKQGESFLSVRTNDDFGISTRIDPGATQPVPKDLSQAYRLCRRWSEGGPNGPANSFIAMILWLRLSFYDYGFSVTGEDEKQVADWYRRNRAVVTTYRRDSWMEFLRTCCCVGLWRGGGVGRPVRIRPEECKYTDTFGEELLEYRHNLSSQQIDAMRSLTPTQKRRLKEENPIKLTQADAALFGFAVVKRNAIGEGLPWPLMMSAFLGAGTQESLQVADFNLAYGMRRVIEQHKLGHSIVTGQLAGSSVHFAKKPRVEATAKSFKGKNGYNEAYGRHDHEIVWPRPDPKHFDPKRYEAAKEQLIDWAMPLGHIIFAKAINPYLLMAFKYLAVEERRIVGAHLETVFEKCLGAPAGITVSWSEKCFDEPRLALDMIKTALATGPLSQETFLERIGEQATEERKRKEKEDKLPKGQTHPITPAAGAAVKATAGRKTGSGDNPEA